MQAITITTNATTAPVRTILSNGFQAFATGTWGGAQIELQISGAIVGSAGWVTIATLTESNPFLEQIQIMQGAYFQFVITGTSPSITNLSLVFGWLGLYQA